MYIRKYRPPGPSGPRARPGEPGAARNVRARGRPNLYGLGVATARHLGPPFSERAWGRPLYTVLYGTAYEHAADAEDEALEPEHCAVGHGG